MERRLAAILAADVAGYSRMIGADEAGALAALRAFRSEVFGPAVGSRRGKIIKSMGDGWLVEFESAVDAVNCALQIQNRLADQTRIALRIGVHIGDVVHEEEDIFGDGVNIAARLEAMAEPGGIAISDSTYSSLDGTLTPSFDDAGMQTLKNIDRPMRVWTKGATADAPVTGGAGARTAGFPRLSIQPVATSDDRAEVQDLADGLTGDLDATLSGVRWLVTTVRKDPDEAAYALRCALRSRGDRLRLEARLFEPGGAQIWSSKIDGDLADSFDWQDSTSETVAADVIPRMLDAESERLSGIPPKDRTAEEWLVYGYMQFRMVSPQSFLETISTYMRAIERDPNLADAYGEAIWTTYAGMTVGLENIRPLFEGPYRDWVEKGRPLAARSPKLAVAIALADFHEDGDPGPLRIAVADALRKAPSDASVLMQAGWSSLWSGDKLSIAQDCFRKIERFGRAHPSFVPAKGGAAMVALQLGDDALAIRLAEEGLASSRTYATFFAVLASAYAHSDQPDKAAAAMASYRELVPNRTVTKWMAMNSYGGSDGGKRYFEGLRKAGLPE